MSSGRVGVLDTTARRLEWLVRSEQATGRLPSLVAGVVLDDELVWTGTAGAVLERDSDNAPTPRTQYRIGSITKTMTAVLVLQLRDAGRVALSDRLDAHVPGAPYGERTLLQLLSHASGMPAEPPGDWWERAPGRPRDDLFAHLDPGRVAVRPDERFHYSNVGFALLGELVARLHGASWTEVLQTRLLEPLGMRRTTYLPEAPYARGFSVHAFAGTLTDEPTHDSGAMAPAGQIWSTVVDLATYASFLLHPEPAVLAPDTMREMTVVHTGSPDDATSNAYGLGLRVAVESGRTYVGHTGSMPGFLAGIFADRERKSAAVCLANGFTGLRAQGLPLDLLRTLDECEPAMPEPWMPSSPPPKAVADLLGLWHWGNVAFTLSYEGERLVSRMLDARETWCTYQPDGADRFVGTSGYHTGEILDVRRRGDGSIDHLECATFVFTRKPYDVPRNS